MAEVDTSIYRELLKRPKSVAEYDAEHRQAKVDQLNMLMGQAKYDAMQRDVQRQAQLDALLRGGADASRLRSGGFLEQANAWDKNAAEVGQKNAQAGKDKATASATQYKLSRDKIEHMTTALSQFQTPEEARDYIAGEVEKHQSGGDGLPMEAAKQLLSRIPRERDRFGEWKVNTLKSVMGPKEQIGFVEPDANTRANIASREGEGEKNRASRERVAQTLGGQIIQTAGGIMKVPHAGAQATPVTDPTGKQVQPPVKPTKAGALPTPALKMENEELEGVAVVSGMNEDIKRFMNQIETGELKLGPAENISGRGRNLLGLSNKNSQNLRTLDTTLKKWMNDIKITHKGTQTNKDAQDYMESLIGNINDPKVVIEQLRKLLRTNEREIMRRKGLIHNIRRNYGLEGPQIQDFERGSPARGTQDREGALASAEADYGDE